MSENTLFNILATAPAEAVCMHIQGRNVSYGTVRDQALRIAQGLRDAGIRRGDTAALWLPNLPEWLSIAWACARIGVNVLPLNMRYGTREVGDFLSRSRASALFYMPGYRGLRYDETLCNVEPERLSTLRITVAAGPRDAEKSLAGVQALGLDELLRNHPCKTEDGQAEDRAIVFASSGTTSLPKLICHLQRSVARHARDVDAAFHIGQQSRVLLAVPFGGAFGYTIAVGALAAHATLVVQEQFDPAEAADLLASQQATHMFGTDDMIDKLLTAAGPDARFPALQVYGHANFTPALGATLPAKAAAHGVPLRGCYGLSEAMALFATQPEDGTPERRAMSGGIPVCPQGKVRVRSLETGQLLAPGESGEIEIFSPNLTVGYLGDDAATKKAFCEDDFLRTGDLGYMMDDGGVILLSRIGDVLRIGGYLVNPLEIEETVLALCGAAACQVIALDANKSVRPVAFVIGKPGYVHDERAIIEGCRNRLATYKVPIRVFEVPDFPVTDSPNGKKVRKNVLKDMAIELIAAEKESQ
ncbi:AMP-binding protein [Lacisediminimonas profundi]|uniref:AMP-binding protein n=1 Tax=Lacisediminimonas profundi TaxID=2603856 RepID=UPI00124BAEA6|nr:AMP-binding protein [Lacisediminimonas profundi]